MSMIQLSNGTQAFILNPRDLVDIAYNALGGEFSEEIEKVITKASEDEIYQEKRFNSDMLSYEGQIEDYRNIMIDTIEELEKLVDTIEESKRINREDILKQLKQSIKNLNSEL
jgi:5'-deoxynucleotidase YfbR-like HD superfamily hydrolase